MVNQVIKKFLQLGNDQDKNEYIRDLSNSICTYVRTGNKNELLDNFLVYAVEIKHEIKQTFAKKENIDSPKQMEIEWDSCMKKIMYLSHLNMLYEMYIQEMNLKEEQKKYIKASVEFPKLFKIATEINKQRRMLINKLKEQLSLSDEEFNYIATKYKMYFNFRKDKNGQIIQISLSPNGKNYLSYMYNKEIRNII